jgi:hypothetical protein
MHETLPLKTLRDLGGLLVYFAELAWNGTKTFAQKIAPFVRPPPDMNVTCGDGGRYSGVIVIEDNDVTTGAVIRVCHDAAGTPLPAVERPWSNSERPGAGHRHWATDPRDREDDSWHR